MNLLLKDEAGHPGVSRLYDFQPLHLCHGYPTADCFEVVQTTDGRGMGVRTLTSFRRGDMICKISGIVINERRLHTLQITPHSHLYDPYFSGLLLHCCDPNVFLDMSDFELWAIKDIAAGKLLQMDYASTEDILMRQFACRCGAPNCRGWITGSKEEINQEGRRHLAGNVAALAEN